MEAAEPCHHISNTELGAVLGTGTFKEAAAAAITRMANAAQTESRQQQVTGTGCLEMPFCSYHDSNAKHSVEAIKEASGGWQRAVSKYPSAAANTLLQCVQQRQLRQQVRANRELSPVAALPSTSFGLAPTLGQGHASSPTFASSVV